VLKRFADRLAFPEDSYPARFIETAASDWAVSKRLLNQIEASTRVTEDSNGQASLLTDIDVDYQTRRIQFVPCEAAVWVRVHEHALTCRAQGV
jgi:hypothetical protein